MTQLKISRWLKRGAFAVIACAAIAMVSAEQANAQFYGGRGISINSGLRGFNLNIGNGFNRGLNYGGLNYGRGYGGYGNFNSGYRYVPQTSYYRGGGSYGRGVGYGVNSFPYQSRYYSRGRY